MTPLTVCFGSASATRNLSGFSATHAFTTGRTKMNILVASQLLLSLGGILTITYIPRLTPNIQLFDHYLQQKKRKRANKDAEEVAFLIALAQKDAEMLNTSRFCQNTMRRAGPMKGCVCFGSHQRTSYILPHTAPLPSCFA